MTVETLEKANEINAKIEKYFTDYYKIGLLNRGIKYDKTEALQFKENIEKLLPNGNFEFKNSFKKLIGE